MDRAVFLDRDNTIIHNDGDLGDPRGVRLIQGAASAIASLRGLGYKIVVVSNQGGVARGKYGVKDVDAVNQRIAELVRINSGAIIDRFYYCPYHPQGSVAEFCQEHPWRKPAPGMLRQAAEDLKLDLGHSWMVGDAMRDIEAGAAAGTRTILLHDRDEPPKVTEGGIPGVEPDFVTRSLVEAVRIVAQHRQKTVELLPAVDGNKIKPPLEPPEPSEPPEPLDVPPEAAHGPSERANDRPWVPWDVQPQQAPLSTPPKPLTRPKKVAAAPPAPAPPVPAPPAPRPASAPAQPPELSAPEASSKPPLIEPPPRQPGTPPAATVDENVRDLLQQILRELKAHRADLGDFAMSKMFAAILQMVAAGCVLFSLFHMAEPALFAQWFAGAIFSQLLVITLLLVHGLK